MHSLTLRIRKRMTNGIAAGATYTLARSVDNASSIGGGAGVVAQNDLDLEAERGLSSFDQRHRFSGDVTYELPFGAKKRWFTSGTGAVVRAVHRAAAQAQPTYDALCQTVKTSAMVVADETGWRVQATWQWLWVFVTPDTTVYAILPGRGFDEAATVLGVDFAGILVRDGWAPYRKFTEALHQSCVGHLLRRCRELQIDHPRAALPGHVQDVLQQALAVRDRYAAGTISLHGVAVARGHLETRLATVLDRRTTLPAVQRLVAHLDREGPALFGFLHDPTVDATNWRAEQALRGAVITRKVNGGGNRTAHGAVTQHGLASVLRTARQRDLDGIDVRTTLLRAPTPIISPVLCRASAFQHPPARVAPGGAAPLRAEPTPVTSALAASTKWGCPATGPVLPRVETRAFASPP